MVTPVEALAMALRQVRPPDPNASRYAYPGYDWDRDYAAAILAALFPATDSPEEASDE